VATELWAALGELLLDMALAFATDPVRRMSTPRL
jgi:hypothetical protein